MKFVFVALVSLFIFSDAQAALSCARFFDPEISYKELKQKTETRKGARHFTIHGFRGFEGGQLDVHLREYKNLTQFSEGLEQIVSYTRDHSTVRSIPSDAYYIANRLVPLIIKFLEDHGVNYTKDTYDKNGVTRTDIVITSEGTNYLNRLAAKLEVERSSLRINPVSLIYENNGYNTHYRQSRGRFFEVDGYTPAYSISFSTLRHSQDKDFRQNISKEDPQLSEVSEMLAMELRNAKSQADFLGREEQARQDEIQALYQKRVDHIQSLIDKARSQKPTETK